MLFTEKQLQMNTNPFSILDNATYLTQSENQIHPQMIPVIESSRLQSYIIDFNGIRQLSESTGLDYIDSIVLVSEEEGIDPSEVCIAVDEAELIESPELANLGPIVVRPLSENDMVYLQTKLITDSYLESENLEGLDAILSLNEVEATPVVHSRIRHRDFFRALAARPKDMDGKQGMDLYDAIIKLRKHINFDDLAAGSNMYKNPLVHFKWKGQKYIGRLGYFDNLLAGAKGLSDNERASVSNKMEDDKRRPLKGFLGFRYKGNEPPTASGSTLLRIFDKTVGRIFESPSANSAVPTSTIDVPKLKETPPPLIDLDTLFSSEKPKEPEPEPKVDNTDHKSSLSHSSLSPVTTLERIKIAVPRIGLGLLAGTAAGMVGYKILQAYRNQPKSVIGKKIAALRHIYQNWMNKAASCRDSGLVAKLKRGAARILQLIDRLMSFLQKKAG